MDGHRLRSRHTAPLTPFETILICACDHVIGTHDADGCAGGRLRSCPCRLSREAVLAEAIDRASLENLAYWTESASSTA